MNNGRVILETQRSRENIWLLAAQRQLYSEAKHWETAQFIASFAIPLAMTFAQVLRFVSIDATWCVVVETFILIALTALQRVKSEKKQMAARIQQAFDSNVYGIAFENKDYEPGLMKRKAQQYIDQHGDSELRNWYSCVSKDMKAGEAVSKCQQMNCGWSKRLAGRYSVAVIGSSIILLAILTLMVLITGTDPFALVFLLTIVEWAMVTAYCSFRGFKAYDKLDEDIRSYSLVSTENIRKVQRSLYEARKNAQMVPDWLDRKSVV